MISEFLIGGVIISSFLWLGVSFFLESVLTIDEGENLSRKTLLPALLVGFLISGNLTYWAKEEPGTWNEKPDYTRKLIVNAFPDGEYSKNYRVPATITHSSGDYYLDEVFFKSGSSVKFDHGGNESLIVGEEIIQRDNLDRLWRIELTTEIGE